jgi:hypothetical protein
MNVNLKRGLLALAALGAVATVTQDALAIIGRPLTPFSYAGVARRTVRRSAYWGAAAATTGAYYNTMPVGCVVGVPCGGVAYRPAYAGPNVVYVAQ